MSHSFPGTTRVFLAVILTGMLGSAALHAGSPTEMAKWVPDDTMIYVGVANVKTLGEKLKQSYLYDMYKDPSMQRFIVPAEEKLRAKFDEFAKEAWQEIGLEEPPQELPWPQGRIMAAIFIQTRTRIIPDYSKMTEQDYMNGAFDPENLPKKQIVMPDFQIVLMAEMGDNMEPLRDLAKKISAQAIEKGMIRQREEIRGVEINICRENADADPDFDTFCYGFRDNWVIVGSSVKYIREVLMRITDPDRPNLDRQRDFVEMNKRLGESDFFMYVNAEPIREVVKASVPDTERAEVAQAIQSLGLEEVTGLGMSLRTTPSKVDMLRMKAQLGVRGEKKGIVKILTPETGAPADHPLLQKGVASFLVANYDPMKIYDEIVKIVWSIGKVNLDGMIQGSLMMLSGSQGEETRPPVNFRTQVIGQLAKPLLVTTRIQKPFSEPESSRSLLAIGVRDGEILDTALARLHEMFLAQGKKEMRRELLDHTIYVLPEVPFFNMYAPREDGEIEATSQKLAFGVAGDQFVLGSLSGLEQTIRDVRSKDRESIQTDPMYQYARRYLPEQAGMYFYENQQITAEQGWYVLKEVLPKIIEKAKEESSQFEQRQEDMPNFPLGSSSEDMIASEFFDFLDFTLLPDFETVKHYYGPAVGYVTENDNGIYAELIGLKAPADGTKSP